jgi:hypothetical protein
MLVRLDGRCCAPLRPDGPLRRGPAASRDACARRVRGTGGSGEITLDIAKAFGATSDQEIQARVFEQASSGYYAPNPDSIRRMVLSGTVRGSDPRARLVGRDAYIAAGGRIERELFDDDDSESWVDVALLEALASEEMEETRQVARRRAGSCLGQADARSPTPATIWSKAWFGFPPSRRR